MQTKQVPLPWRLGKPGKPLLIAHRAGCGEAPENTIAAMKHSEKAGAQAMQMDILPSKDGVPLLVQNKDLLRLTGKALDVTETLAADVPALLPVLEPPLLEGPPGFKLDAREFGPMGRRVGTLAELLAQVGADTHLILETWKDDDALIRQVADMIQEAGMSHRVTLGNPFSNSIWRKCRDSIPDVQTILPFWEINKLTIAYLLGLLPLCAMPANTVFNIPLVTDAHAWIDALARMDGRGDKMGFAETLALKLIVHAWKWMFTRKGLFQALQARGIPVVVFILNTPAGWELAAQLGANAVQTDFPAAYAAWQEHRDQQ